MDSHSSSAIQDWLARCESGESIATQGLWDRYFERLTKIAEKRLGGGATELTGEDVALSAIKSLVLGAREQKFPQLGDATSLWPLLVAITVRKAISQRRRELAAKRDRNREVPLTDQVEGWLAERPTAALLAEIKDELRRLYDGLEDPQLQRIVELRLSGHSNDEIADRLSCAKRTVIRKTKLIRAEWLASSDRSAAVGDR